MRFNNDDYLRAFPRDDRAAADKQIISEQQKPGNVFENVEKPAASEDPETPEQDIDTDQEGGGDLGDE